jgi:hypothetical protein
MRQNQPAQMTTGPRHGSKGLIPEIRRVDPSNPRRHRRVSTRGTKRRALARMSPNVIGSMVEFNCFPR